MKSDSHKEAYSAGLTTLFSATRQMSAITLSAAVGRGLPYRVVARSECDVRWPQGKVQQAYLFGDQASQGCSQPPEGTRPYLVTAYGVSEAAPAADAAPELPLLLERFGVRPTLTKGELAQKASPIELLIAGDYRQYWPMQTDSSQFASDNLYLMRTIFHPGQLLFGEADPEAVGSMKKGVKRRLTQGMGESA
jgi:hypothetical protein